MRLTQHRQPISWLSPPRENSVLDPEHCILHFRNLVQQMAEPRYTSAVFTHSRSVKRLRLEMTISFRRSHGRGAAAFSSSREDIW